MLAYAAQACGWAAPFLVLRRPRERHARRGPDVELALMLVGAARPLDRRGLAFASASGRCWTLRRPKLASMLAGAAQDELLAAVM